MLRKNNGAKIISIFSSIILLGVVFVAGIYVGYSNQPAISQVTELTSKKPLEEKTVSFSPYWKVWKAISNKYPDVTDVSPQERLWGSISGLVDSLEDPYSVFLPPDDAKSFEEDISGEFGGVGIEVGMRDDVMTVIAPLKGTPADQAGMQPGDKILEIEGAPTTNITLDEAVSMIRGERGTEVTLTVLSPGAEETKEVRIVRDTIEIPVIDTRFEEEGSIFVVELYNFTAQAADKFTEAMEEFRNSSAEKMILDLRGNPGGFLQGSIDVASHFLPAGKKVLIERYQSSGEDDTVYRSTGDHTPIPAEKEDFEMVILINYGTASASEIVSGALREHDIATLVGEQTYGKGTVQELIPITASTSLKLTVAKWLTPDGQSISEAGITPDHEVSLTQEDMQAGNDPQLEKALELLR